jgi:hypothetical protein
VSATQSTIIAITTLPATDVVAEVVQSGLLEARLQLGLEHVFVSMHAITMRPELALPLRRLAKRYSSNFALMPFPLTNQDLQQVYPDQDRLAAVEHLAVGANLAGEYRKYYGCTRDWQKVVLYPADMPVYRHRIGVIPDGLFLLLRESPIDVGIWKDLDAEMMAEMLATSQGCLAAQAEAAVEALRQTLDRKGPRP